MLDQLQSDVRELLDLTRQAENFDATIAARQLVGQPIELGPGAAEERARKGQRIRALREKWNL